MLPGMKYADGMKKSVQTAFGGYDHRRGAGEGALYDMENLTSAELPLLSARRPRRLVRELAKPNGFTACDGLYWVDGTGFYKDGVQKGTVSDSRKTFAVLGAYLLIFPDKAYYHRETGVFGSLEATWTGNVTFADGTLYGESAAGCCIVTTGTAFPFEVGDAVTVTGCVTHPENNKTPVVREKSADGKTLTFYENCFTVGAESGAVTLSRDVPDMDYVCVNENRLWGCRGDTVYASKLGDPKNFNVFEGLSTDSYAADVGSAGDFTGACAFLGYPCFFKEAHIYKVYGDQPSNYQVMASASLGTSAGSGASFGVAGEILFYLSRAGVVAFSGGVPENLSAPFGDVRYRNAVGGSDGVRYYVSMEAYTGARSLFVYDTRYAVWHREDGFDAVAFGWQDGLYALARDGGLWLLTAANADATAETTNVVTAGSAKNSATANGVEETVSSFAEFADFTEGAPERKGAGKLELRMELVAGSRVTVRIQYDSDGVWHDVRTLEASRKRSFLLPVIPRRCDHYRLRLEGRGMWRLYSLARSFYTGSDLH